MSIELQAAYERIEELEATARNVRDALAVAEQTYEVETCLICLDDALADKTVLA